jgi:hypothetical protein
MCAHEGAGRIVGMTTPPRPEADMLHMQHAHVVALLIRQHDAALEKARRDAAAKVRKAAQAAQPQPATEATPAPARTTRKTRVPGPRTA